ncbi:MAG: hypothetical protein ABJN98_01875, partial [Roseibium sp.]
LHRAICCIPVTLALLSHASLLNSEDEPNSLPYAIRLSGPIGADGEQVVLDRGKGQSASGAALPPIIIRRQDLYSGDLDIEERTAHEKTSESWFDPKIGRPKRENKSIGRKGGPHAGLHVAPNKSDAKGRAEATAKHLNRFTGTGSFELKGNAVAMAGAPVILQGFEGAIEAVPLVSSVVTHTIVPEDGWTMTVEVETAEAAG